MASRGVLFDRRGNPTPLALALVCGVCIYVYRGNEWTSSHATHANAAAQLDIPPPTRGGGGDDAELQRALRRMHIEPAADARARPARRDPIPRDPVVAAVAKPRPPPPPLVKSPAMGERPQRVERVAVPDYRPVGLTLQLPDKYLNEPALESREKMFRQCALPLISSCSCDMFECQ